jgi:hypothetical protein
LDAGGDETWLHKGDPHADVFNFGGTSGDGFVRQSILFNIFNSSRIGARYGKYSSNCQEINFSASNDCPTLIDWETQEFSLQLGRILPRLLIKDLQFFEGRVKLLHSSMVLIKIILNFILRNRGSSSWPISRALSIDEAIVDAVLCHSERDGYVEKCCQCTHCPSGLFCVKASSHPKFVITESGMRLLALLDADGAGGERKR